MGFSSKNEENLITKEDLPPRTAENMGNMEKAEKV